MMTEPDSNANRRANADTSANGTGKAQKKEDNFFVFLVKLVVIVVIFRSFIFSPFNIPSESMQPRLVDGDYLLAAKWPYGYLQLFAAVQRPAVAAASPLRAPARTR